MKIIDEEGALVIKSWCEAPEDGAILQAKNMARLPFAFRHIGLMPDLHKGYGMPIGGVLATQGVIIPNAVGVDIGCGVYSVQTSLPFGDLTATDALKKIMGKIREQIPVGFNKHKAARPESLMPATWMSRFQCDVVYDEYENARKSLGTLGGGNHFIEIQRGDDGYIWFMIHSGSRNLGKKVADFYNKKAVEINARYFSSVPASWELAFLPLETEAGPSYIREMEYCVEYALANRNEMGRVIKDIFREVCGAGIEFTNTINIAHNYARMEHHFGKDVMVHRKGATSARLREMGLIPGSQGTASYVVSGKGNPESFESCSHGAGRAMGRKQAERTLNLADEQKRLDDKGILHSIRGVHDLDEAAGAYKPIETVMSEQKDLVEILVKLEPLGVAKG